MKEWRKNKNGIIIDIDYYRELFESRWGDPDRAYKVESSVFEKYTGILPEELLYYWRKHGFSSFRDGLLWLTNPEEYTVTIEEYLSGTQFEGRRDLYVIARSAFGELYLWETGKGNTLSLTSFLNMIFFDATADRKSYSKEEENLAMAQFFLIRPNGIDKKDSRGRPLFGRALKKFGKINCDEMYAYKLALFLGGKDGISNMDKVNLFNHFSIQRQLREPELIISDIENNTLIY